MTDKTDKTKRVEEDPLDIYRHKIAAGEDVPSVVTDDDSSKPVEEAESKSTRGKKTAK